MVYLGSMAQSSMLEWEFCAERRMTLQAEAANTYSVVILYMGQAFHHDTKSSWESISLPPSLSLSPSPPPLCLSLLDESALFSFLLGIAKTKMRCSAKV